MVMLSGCATTSKINQEMAARPQKDQSSISISNEERNTYRNAITALNNNQLDISESILKEILAHRPDLAGPWANLGLVYYKKNDAVNAVIAFQRSLKINPKQPNALNLMGVIEYNKGNIQKALEYYISAIQNKPDYANAHYNLALLYDIYHHDTPKAIEHYQHYMKITKYQDKETATWLQQLTDSVKK